MNMWFLRRLWLVIGVWLTKSRYFLVWRDKKELKAIGFFKNYSTFNQVTEMNRTSHNGTSANIKKINL